ncbi:MAG TPA: HAMP domain-containing sensor histidine kinase [Candidatus Saccharimonadia bacterium]|nr:HAMP domain-containing sensor histidine kinase [Candidatus Saccharimonadia bacterium]
MSEQLGYTLRNLKVVCDVIFIGTYAVIAAIVILLLVSWSNSDASAPGSLGVCGIAFLSIAAVQLLARRGYRQVAAYLLVLFYLLLAAGIAWSWGINLAMGTLIFGLVIVLAGILLTARHALYAAVAAGSILAIIQSAISLGWHRPDTSWTSVQSSFGDVLGYCVVFGMLALVSWLYNREMERSLAQAKQAELALRLQKATLKSQVKERTAELRRVQLEEMRQMYRFAELGQLGVTLLHDLANHLTALTLEIEGLHSEQHSQAITRAGQIIGYLEKIVDSTRERLRGDTKKQSFDIIRKTNEVVTFLHYKAAKRGVTIEWQPPAQSWSYVGDPTCFCQVVATIISNAIDAYGPASAALSQPRRVVVVMQRDEAFITIRVSDWGKGISKSERKNLFKPFHSTKKSGLGLGLYIAQQTVETQFLGSVTLNPQSDHTEFIIKLALKHEG